MSTFEVKVYRLNIEPHPNADALELCRVGDYVSCVLKDQFKTDDLGVYIPEASIVPNWLIEKLGLVGKLAGAQHNRVKAVKLRGIVSQGLILPMDIYPFHMFGLEGDPLPDQKGLSVGVSSQEVNGVVTTKYAPEGTDVAEFLGITKWEPPIPTHMSGEVYNGFGYTIKYDVENIKKYPSTFTDGEEVVMTEKAHGTWCCYGYNRNFIENNGYVITSKGLSGQGLCFMLNEANKDNLYIRTLATTKVITERCIEEDVISRGLDYFDGQTFYILGEVFGPVQDLTYGFTTPQFRVFDIYVGEPGGGYYLNYDQLTTCCKSLEVEIVPLLYRGPYGKDKLIEMTNGKETISGKSLHIREGIVIKPVIERYHTAIGRIQMKSVSDDYLLRKGNVTELT